MKNKAYKDWVCKDVICKTEMNKLFKKSSKNNVREIVGLVEWIIDDTYLVLSIFSVLKFQFRLSCFGISNKWRKQKKKAVIGYDDIFHF